ELAANINEVLIHEWQFVLVQKPLPEARKHTQPSVASSNDCSKPPAMSSAQATSIFFSLISGRPAAFVSGSPSWTQLPTRISLRIWRIHSSSEVARVKV